MIKFPSIVKFRNIVRMISDRASYVGRDENNEPIYDRANAVLPTLTFTGTVKMHGTNAGINFHLSKSNPNDDGNIQINKITYQSRENELSDSFDNAGFYAEMSRQEITDYLSPLIIQIANQHNSVSGNVNRDITNIVLFGEWCGGNIQKKVALNELPKMFVIFDILFAYSDGTSEFIEYNTDAATNVLKQFHNPELNIYNSLLFPYWKININFSHPEEAQNQLIELTEMVENECPVGKYFGVSGVGEGIVWRCNLKSTDGVKDTLRFKVKGEKHSVSKVKTLAPIDIEKVENAKNFVEYAVTDNRMEQCLQFVMEQNQLKDETDVDMCYFGQFSKWLSDDVIKEEKDTMLANNLDFAIVKKQIGKKAKEWFTKRLNIF